VDITALGNDKKVSLFKRATFHNVDEALKKINTNFKFEYQFKFKNQTITDSKIDNLNAKLFLEKGDKIIDWGEEKQVQVNFLGNFVLDMIIMNLKFWTELIPNKYDDYQHTVDFILENDLRQSFWDMSKSFAYLEEDYIAHMRSNLKLLNNSIYHQMKIAKEYLLLESHKFLNNPKIMQTFSETKTKLRDCLKYMLNEKLFDTIQKKYVEGNMKNVESYISLLSKKQNVLTQLTYENKSILKFY